MSRPAAATPRSRSFTGKPCRMLRNEWTQAWETPGNPEPLGMPFAVHGVRMAVAATNKYPNETVDVAFNPVGRSSVSSPGSKERSGDRALVQEASRRPTASTSSTRPPPPVLTRAPSADGSNWLPLPGRRCAGNRAASRDHPGRASADRPGLRRRLRARAWRAHLRTPYSLGEIAQAGSLRRAVHPDVGQADQVMAGQRFAARPAAEDETVPTDSTAHSGVRRRPYRHIAGITRPIGDGRGRGPQRTADDGCGDHEFANISHPDSRSAVPGWHRQQPNQVTAPASLALIGFGPKVCCGSRRERGTELG